jgi:cytidine deaminase
MGTKAVEEFGSEIKELAREAWRAREFAYVIGPTSVGCTVLGVNGKIYSGCNVEHRFRSHDVHAEVNAISTMVVDGCRSFTHIFVAAQRERFTPCGACMDWIMQFADGGDCVVMAQNSPSGPIQEYTAKQLMPFYPH